MKKICLLLFLLASQMSFGSEVFLVKATNDEDREITKLYLALDERSDIVRFTKRTYSAENKLLNAQTFDVGQESGETKIVLDERDGREVLALASENFSSHQGADISLVYLYNGLTGSTGELPMDLKRDGDQWRLSVDGRLVSHLHLVSNKKWMVGTIGIKAIKIIR